MKRSQLFYMCNTNTVICESTRHDLDLNEWNLRKQPLLFSKYFPGTSNSRPNGSKQRSFVIMDPSRWHVETPEARPSAGETLLRCHPEFGPNEWPF